MRGEATLCIDALSICVPFVLVTSVQLAAALPEIKFSRLFRAGIVVFHTRASLH
jgi:hypothetical protein